MIIIGRLAYIFFVHGKEYSERAYNQQMKNQIISPKRGNIYDSNGNVLAKSVVAYTISINPGKVCYADGKKVENEVMAQGLADNLGLDYNAVLEQISAEMRVQVIAKKSR